MFKNQRICVTYNEDVVIELKTEILAKCYNASRIMLLLTAFFFFLLLLTVIFRKA